MLPDFRKELCCLEGCQASPVCPSVKIKMEQKTSTGHWWNSTDRGRVGKSDVFGEKSVPNATTSTTDLTRTDLGSHPSPHGDRLETNRLSHGTAF